MAAGTSVLYTGTKQGKRRGYFPMYILILDNGNPLIHIIAIHKKECFPPVDLGQPTTPGNKSTWHRFHLDLKENIRRSNGVEVLRGGGGEGEHCDCTHPSARIYLWLA